MKWSNMCRLGNCKSDGRNWDWKTMFFLFLHIKMMLPIDLITPRLFCILSVLRCCPLMGQYTWSSKCQKVNMCCKLWPMSVCSVCVCSLTRKSKEKVRRWSTSLVVNESAITSGSKSSSSSSRIKCSTIKKVNYGGSVQVRKLSLDALANTADDDHNKATNENT